MIKLTEMNKKDMREFEVASAMSTLQRAQDIQKDAKLMADVKKAAMAEVKKLQSLAGSSTPKKTLSRKKTLKRK
jgi:hypothetical protein|tara:strand:- start:72 stop:293 length:222 start_codon:yes stop_codon:yes gene_type:complete